jgi:hypothetical protein
MDLPKPPLLLPAPKKNLLYPNVVIDIKKISSIATHGIMSIGIITLIVSLISINCMDFSKPLSFENLLSNRCMLTVHSTEKITNVLGVESSKPISDEMAKNIDEWNIILHDHPTYRDGWVQLSYLYYNAGNQIKAKEMLQQAIQIDPVGTKVEASIKKIETLLNVQK